MNILKTTRVFTTKMIDGQAKQLQNVHKTETRNEVMSEMPERATQKEQSPADQRMPRLNHGHKHCHPV